MLKRDYDLAEILAEEYVRTQGTVRSVAKKYGIPKSRVHRYINEVIEDKSIHNADLVKAVETLILKNKAERHMRGGNATKNKFLKKQK